MGTDSEEPLGLYRKSDPDGALRVTDLRSSLGLPETLGADQDGKIPVLVVYSNSRPDHLHSAHRLDGPCCEPEGRSSPRLMVETTSRRPALV